LKKRPTKSGGKKVPQRVIKIAKILHIGNTLIYWGKYPFRESSFFEFGKKRSLKWLIYSTGLNWDGK